MFKSKIFWIAALIFAIVIFIVSLNTGCAFKGKTDVLFLPKSDKAAGNINQILANAEALPRSLSFYEKLLELNPDIEDPVSGQTDENRKKFWEEKISLQRLGTSGIIQVNAFSDDQLQAEILSRKTATDTIAVMSRYYDAKNDLDMRVIDGPIVFAPNKNKDLAWILLSILLGIAAGMIAYLLSDLAKTVSPKIILAKPAIFKNEKPFEFAKILPKEKAVPKMEAAKIFQAPKTETQYFATAKKAGAPENLPINEKFTPETGAKTKEPDAAKKEELKKTHEATTEEVRARLNKLLSGGM